MNEYRRGSHTIYDIQLHLVWVTKYRYHVLKGEVGLRARDLIRQSCSTREVQILQGSVGSDHVHLLVSIPPELSISKLMQFIKGRTSHLLQSEFPHLHKRYWGRHFWARGYFCASVGTVTEETIRDYIANQETRTEVDDAFKVEKP